eukprot:TRINITY_DN3790_c0_g1_i2.p1 TRINITY_DN3790_c0_g1~~TRINITY_DN3790_c0_g1_i2.p1  ORF type:complete len:155 (+),score=14.87 TRINITY_DN3790_c0_g1_i2:15-479(+)
MAETKVATDAGEWFRACRLETLRLSGRLCAELDMRTIVIFYFRRNNIDIIHAIDSRCYHMGGPMIEASIEDLGNHIVAICPWHKYRINLTDGDGVYNALPDGELRSKGRRQRVWPTRIVDDWVEVKIYWPEKRDLPSDAYQTKDLAERKRLGLS